MSLFVNVWYYNDLLSEWILKTTNDYQETKDELKYFRVMSNGKKVFYESAEQYFLHNKNYIKDDTLEFTDVNGKIIYLI